MIANIFELSLFSKNTFEWLLLVHYGSIWVEKDKKYGNGQIIQKQYWANILIFKYIQ